MSNKSNPNDPDVVETTKSRDANPDPITGAPGSHPVGTGVGAAAGGAAGIGAAMAAGAAAGSTVGPVGTAVGAAIGAVAGGLAGKAVAENIDPTAEDAYWRENYKTRPYFSKDKDYAAYAPAYRLGWESRSTSKYKSFEEAEPELRTRWEREQGKTGLGWDKARLASRDAWERIGQGGRAAIPVVEEQLQVGKREVEQGGVRIHTTQTEKPVQASVNLREEQVNVERHRVDRPASTADLNQPGRDAAVEVTAKSEVPIVNKEARVVEEVVVNKDVKERAETVRDSVRKTDVKVEKVEGDATTREANRSKTDR
jgi:uncharacterized protein (TIGR02271 family)